MITDPDAKAARSMPEPSYWLPHAAAALTLWALLIIVVTALFEPSPDVLLIGPPDLMIRTLDGSDSRLVDAGAAYVRVRGMERGFVRALYANGAWLIIPAGIGGCIGLDTVKAGTGKQLL
jgi:hypothetical protein